MEQLRQEVHDIRESVATLKRHIKFFAFGIGVLSAAFLGSMFQIQAIGDSTASQIEEIRKVSEINRQERASQVQQLTEDFAVRVDEIKRLIWQQQRGCERK